MISKVLNASLPDLDFEQDHTNDATDEGNTAVLKFVNEWLGAIASAVVALFLVQVVHCKSLTPSGIVQLLTDMSYLRYGDQLRVKTFVMRYLLVM